MNDPHGERRLPIYYGTRIPIYLRGFKRDTIRA